MIGLKKIARKGFERIESVFDQAFGAQRNPLHQLGALGWFFYWIVIVSGIYIYIFFDTGVTQAYESLERISTDQWYAGGVMRSLHRYASDAMVVVLLLHMVREFVMDRYRGARWFSWFTGVPLVWFLFACGISGYWVVWDKLAQYIAIATTEWLDALPLFGEPIARNFLNDTTLSPRFFTLMVFFHIVVPLFMLFVMWLHIHRISRPKVNPPRGLALGTLLTLLVLSLAKPAVSQAPANLGEVPASVNLDWFYLQLYPLLDMFSGLGMWLLLVGITVLLMGLPWLPPQRREAAAVINLDNCNGCGRCVVDCPYNAITMEPRSDALHYTQEARVNEELCVACGICVGACPTATPFRRSSDLIAGIELPQCTTSELREKTLAAAADLKGSDRVIVYVCSPGADLGALAGDGVAVVPLACTAMLPPSFLDFVITRGHADGILLTGCREGSCFHRSGIAWMGQRIDRRRDPYLRERVPRERIACCWAGVAHSADLARQLQTFRDGLRSQPPIHTRSLPLARRGLHGHG